MFDNRGERKQARRDLEFGCEGYLGPQTYEPWQIPHYYLVNTLLHTYLKCLHISRATALPVVNAKNCLSLRVAI